MRWLFPADIRPNPASLGASSAGRCFLGNELEFADCGLRQGCRDPATPRGEAGGPLARATRKRIRILQSGEFDRAHMSNIGGSVFERPLFLCLKACKSDVPAGLNQAFENSGVSVAADVDPPEPEPAADH